MREAGAGGRVLPLVSAWPDVPPLSLRLPRRHRRRPCRRRPPRLRSQVHRQPRLREMRVGAAVERGHSLITPLAEMSTSQLAVERNRRHVAAIRRKTKCDHCGGDKIEWHRDGHKTHERISWMVVHGASIETIDAEIARCTPLCRRCHMRLDGRLAVATQHVRNSPRPSGDAHPNTRLTDGQVDEIRRLHASGMTQQQLGEMFGVHRGWVSLVVRGKRRGCGR